MTDEMHTSESTTSECGEKPTSGAAAGQGRMERIETALDRLNDISRRAADALDRHFWATVIAVSAVLALFQIGLICFAGTQMPSADGITYYLKAREIVRGDWTPILSHEIGLPALMAPIMATMWSSDVARQLPVMASVAAVVYSAAVIPIAWMAREWFGRLWLPAILRIRRKDQG